MKVVAGFVLIALLLRIITLIWRLGAGARKISAARRAKREHGHDHDFWILAVAVR